MSTTDRFIDEFIRKVPIQVIQRGGIQLNGFPSSYQSLFNRYTFESFELFGVQFFGNTEEEQGKRMARCEEVRFAEGILVVGSPIGGSYDPICFDGRAKRKNREFPLVQIDHEDALQHSRITLVKVVAPSFYKLVSTFLATSNPCSLHRL